jgi:hypothetical protein
MILIGGMRVLLFVVSAAHSELNAVDRAAGIDKNGRRPALHSITRSDHVIRIMNERDG